VVQTLQFGEVFGESFVAREIFSEGIQIMKLFSKAVLVFVLFVFERLRKKNKKYQFALQTMEI